LSSEAIGELLLAPMPKRLAELLNRDEVRERLNERRRLLRNYLWLVAGVVLVAAIVQLEVSAVNLITDRSEDFYKAALWPGVVLVLLLVFGRPLIRLLREATVESITIGKSGLSMEFTKDDIRRTLDEIVKELGDPETGVDDK
jgi:hypothetical protein